MKTKLAQIEQSGPIQLFAPGALEHLDRLAEAQKLSQIAAMLQRHGPAVAAITEAHEELRAKYDYLEDENAHAACCELMAEYSGCKHARLYARHATLIQEALGALTPPAEHLRYAAYEYARARVAQNEGEEVAAYLFGNPSSYGYKLTKKGA